MQQDVQFESVVRARFGKVKKKHTKNGIEYRVCCPFCLRNTGKADHDYHMDINPSRERWRCWRCPARGSIGDLFENVRSAQNSVFNIPEQTKVLSTVEPPGELVPLTSLHSDHLALRYIRGRKFKPEVWEKYYGARYCTAGKRFMRIPECPEGLFDTSNTIVFPMWMNGVLVGWQCRLLYNPDKLTEDECEAMAFPVDKETGKHIRPPKYFTGPPGLSKGQILFNYDMARQSEVLVITEGVMKAMAAGPCSIATFGKGVSEVQRRMIEAGNWKLAVILQDKDAAREAASLQSELQRAMPTLILRLEGYNDPDEAPTVEIWRQMDVLASASHIDIGILNLGPYWCDEILREV